MEGSQIRLSWKGNLAVIGGTILIGLVFLYFGKLELARPTLVSIVIVGFAVAIKWNLKRHAWFWATIVTITALHIPLILCVPWTTGWIPAFVIMPIGIGDLAVILALIGLLEKQFERTPTKDTGPPH